MAKFPVYEQQTRPSAPRADAEMFGAAQARGLSQVGQAGGGLANRLQEIEVRRQNRADLIYTAMAEDDAKTRFTQRSVDLQQNPSALADPRVLDDFKSYMENQKQEILSEYAGSDASKVELESSLNSMIGDAHREIYKIGSSEQLKFIRQQKEQRAGEWATLVANGPAALEMLLEIGGPVDEYAVRLQGALGDELGVRLGDEIRATLIQTAVKTHLEVGDWESAEATMQAHSETISETVPLTEANNMRFRVLRGKREEQKEQLQFFREMELAKRKHDLDVDMERIKAELAEKSLKWSDLSPMQKIDHIQADRQARGLDPLNEKQIDKVYKTYVKTDPQYGMDDGLRGDAIRTINYVVPHMIAGTTTGDMMSAMDFAVREYMTVLNKDTGQRSYDHRLLPTKVVEAYKRAGMPLPEMGGDPTLGSRGDYGLPENPTQYDTLYELADESAGIFKTLQRLAGTSPAYIGEAAMKSDEVRRAVAAKTYILDTVRDMSRVFRTIARSETERAEIKREMALDPAIFDNEEAYRARVASLYNSLTNRLEHAYKIRREGTGGSEMQEAAKQVLAMIPNFQDRLMPRIVVTSAEEYEKLEPGQKYRDSKGNIGVKSANGPAE